jgi:hypothetical protein
MVGEGSQYPWTALDADGNPFDGAKTYKLHLPPKIPAKDFWSVLVYDTQTRSMLQTDQQFPSVSSQDKDVKANADGSVDVWFGPKAPEGMEHNWVQTIPGKGWFMILRLYGPLEPWFNQTWRPGEIEPVSDRGAASQRPTRRRVGQQQGDAPAPALRRLVLTIRCPLLALSKHWLRR